MDKIRHAEEIGCLAVGIDTDHAFDRRHGYDVIEGMEMFPLSSSELKEIMAIADRIYVLSNGKCTAELTGNGITEDNLVRASYAGLGTGKSA